MNNVEKIARAIFAERHYGIDPEAPIARGLEGRLSPDAYEIPHTPYGFQPAWTLYWREALVVIHTMGLEAPMTNARYTDPWMLIRQSELDRLKEERDGAESELNAALYRRGME